MKKILFFMMLMLTGLFTTTALTSCGDDDEIEDTRIVGTWQDDDTSESIFVYTFYKDGKGVYQDKSEKDPYSEEFTFTFDGKTLVVSGEDDGEKYTDTYTVTFFDNDHVQFKSNRNEVFTLTRIQ